MRPRILYCDDKEIVTIPKKEFESLLRETYDEGFEDGKKEAIKTEPITIKGPIYPYPVPVPPTTPYPSWEPNKLDTPPNWDWTKITCDDSTYCKITDNENGIGIKTNVNNVATAATRLWEEHDGRPQGENKG